MSIGMSEPQDGYAEERQIATACVAIIVPFHRYGFFYSFESNGLREYVEYLQQKKYKVKILYAAYPSEIRGSENLSFNNIVVSTLIVSEPLCSLGPMSSIMDRCRRVLEWCRLDSFNIIVSLSTAGLLYYVQQSKMLSLEFRHTRIVVKVTPPRALRNELDGTFMSASSEVVEGWLECRTIEAADKVIVTCVADRRWLENRLDKFDATRITVRQDQPQIERLVRSVAASDSQQPHEFVFVEEAYPRNGFNHLIKALLKLNTTQAAINLVLLGEPQGDAPILPNWYKSITEHGISVRIKPFPASESELISILMSGNRTALILTTGGHRSRYSHLLARYRLRLITFDLHYQQADWPDSRTVVCEESVEALSDALKNDALHYGIVVPEPTSDSVETLVNPTFTDSEQSCVNDVDEIEDQRRWFLSLIDDSKPISSDAIDSDNDIAAHDVTVCVSHYCRPEKLMTALSSLVSQTVTGFEVIVVDDGSAAEFQAALDAVIEQFTDRLNIKLIRKENAYLGASRNTGWTNVTNSYVLFMDDDNIATPNEIEGFCRAMASGNADVLTCFNDTFSSVADDALTPAVKNRVTPIGSCLALGPIFNCFGDSNSFWKKSVLEKLGGFTEHRGVGKDDNEIFARAALSGYSIEVVPFRLYYYRISDDRMRNFQLVPGASTHRVIKPFTEATSSELADLYSLLVGQSEHISRIESELREHRLSCERSQKRFRIIKNILHQDAS